MQYLQKSPYTPHENYKRYHKTQTLSQNTYENYKRCHKTQMLSQNTYENHLPQRGGNQHLVKTKITLHKEFMFILHAESNLGS